MNVFDETLVENLFDVINLNRSCIRFHSESNIRERFVKFTLVYGFVGRLYALSYFQRYSVLLCFFCSIISNLFQIGAIENAFLHKVECVPVSRFMFVRIFDDSIVETVNILRSEYIRPTKFLCTSTERFINNKRTFAHRVFVVFFVVCEQTISVVLVICL